MRRLRCLFIAWSLLLVAVPAAAAEKPAAQVAMRFTSAFGGKGAGLGQMLEPSDVAVDVAGNIYVADTGNNRIQKFNRHGVYVSEVGHFGWDRDGLNRPTGVTAGPGLDLYVADSENHRIKVYSQHLQVSGLIGGRNQEGSLRLGRVGGVASSRDGEVYATDLDVDQVVQISRFSRTDPAFSGFEYGAGDLRLPSAVDVRDNGDVFVADTENDRVVVFDRFGNYRKAIAEDSVDGPRGVCAGNGIVYVADTGHHRIVAFDVRTGQLAGKLGGPQRGDAPGQFDRPTGLHLEKDRLYVVDSGNGRIQVLTLLVLRK